MPPFAFFPSTGLSQLGKWKTRAGAESSSSSCSKVQLGNSFRQGEQFKLKTSKWIKNVCTLQGRPPHHRHHPPWRLVSYKQSSSPSYLTIYFPWCDKGGRKGLMILCIGGKLLALCADFLNFMIEELVGLKRKRKSFCAPSPQSLVVCTKRKSLFTVFVHHHLSRWLYQRKISAHSCCASSPQPRSSRWWNGCGWIMSTKCVAVSWSSTKSFYFQYMPLYLIIPQASICYPFISVNQGSLACSSQHMLLCLMRRQRGQERSGNFRQHWLFWLNLKALLDLSIGRSLY